MSQKVEYPIIQGEYLHYKGGRYNVLFLSKHSETGESLVNYQSVQFGSYYSRPLDSWNSEPEAGGTRFRYNGRMQKKMRL